MRTPSLMLACAAALATLPANAAEKTKTDRAAEAEAKLAKALEGRVAGAPVSCISMQQIRSSTIVDGTAIIYNVGGTLYVNRPTSGADSLDDDDIMVSKTTGSRLCDLDVVQLVDRSSHFPTGFAGLGKFVPYAKPARTQ